MKVNKYFPFVFVYFFFNSFLLPFGLTYTTLLAPLFYAWILLTRKKDVLLPFLFILLPFVIADLFFIKVEQESFYLSLLNIVMVYISCQAVYTFFKVYPEPESVFRKLLIINFVFCLIAIVLYFTPWYDGVWAEQTVTKGVSKFRRLKLFTYEPSYYATLFVPVFGFYLFQYALGKNTIRSSWLLLMIFLPYVLSFSIGVDAALLIAGVMTFLLFFKQLATRRRVVNAMITLFFFLGAAMVILVLFFRHNPLFTRIINFFAGDDTSGSGRTSDAFIIAGQLLREKSEFWGIGIGQIKIAGAEIIRSFYLYPPDRPVAIPNATAETLAVFGWIGLLLRIGIEVFLFFYTRVWRNYYRMFLFLFIFIYQFTGSFITNIAEYVIWILAFTNIFKQFDTGAWQKNTGRIQGASS
jgi:hypothetical protein